MNLVGILKKNRKLIWSLAKNDFKSRFAGSYLGIFWAFVQPVVTIMVYWFVFQVGFRNGSVDEFPFVLWLTAGLVPWFYFSEALTGASGSLIEYSYLVKKVVFNIDILPMIKALSALFVNLFFVSFFILICSFYGYYPSIYTLQVFYYIVCQFALVIALSYITSAIMVFFRDLGQVIGIVLQIGMWLTPIMWQSSMLGEQYQKFIKLNPMFYIVNGYREAALSKEWFFHHGLWTVYFWGLVFVLLLIGTRLFKRLKPHFADVL